MKLIPKIIRWILTFLLITVAYMVGKEAFGKRQAKITQNEIRLWRIRALKKKREGYLADLSVCKEDWILRGEIREIDRKITKSNSKIEETTDEEKRAAATHYMRNF